MSLREYIRKLEIERTAMEQKELGLKKGTEAAHLLYKQHSEEIQILLKTILKGYSFQEPMVISSGPTVYTREDLSQKITISFTFEGRLALHVVVNSYDLGEIEIHKGSTELLYTPMHQARSILGTPTYNLEQALDFLFNSI